MNLLPLIEAERAKFSDVLLTSEQVGQLMYNIARAAGPDWGLLLKPHGHGVPSPVGRISQDILIHIPEQQEYDVLAAADGEDGAPGPAIPAWIKLPFKVGVPPSGASMDRVVRATDVPVPPVPPTPAPVPPVPPSQPCQCADVIELLTAMRRENAARHGDVLVQLHRLTTATARARKFSGSARFIGQIDGEVSGVQV